MHAALTDCFQASGTHLVKEESLKEGETYEVRIEAVGRKGDGIAKKINIRFMSRYS